MPPYIEQSQRPQVQPSAPRQAQTVGELNYQITELCKQYLSLFGEKYQTVNDIVGALECAKAEFYRRVAAPYEDTKIAANGDVYP